MTSRSKQEKQFAVCVNNKGYEASLETGKLYRVIPDPDASSHAYIRVIDESGEDYGYSVARFFPLEVPQALEKALATTTTLPTEELVQVRTERGTRKKFKQASKVSKTKPRTAARL